MCISNTSVLLPLQENHRSTSHAAAACGSLPHSPERKRPMYIMASMNSFGLQHHQQHDKQPSLSLRWTQGKAGTGRGRARTCVRASSASRRRSAARSRTGRRRRSRRTCQPTHTGDSIRLARSGWQPRNDGACCDVG